jgi:hypothetical protein
VVAAVVFGLNLLPALGPPTWAFLVFYRLTVHLAVVPLVLIGAVAAGSGRLLLAVVFSHLRGRVSVRTRATLAAAERCWAAIGSVLSPGSQSRWRWGCWWGSSCSAASTGAGRLERHQARDDAPDARPSAPH